MSDTNSALTSYAELADVLSSLPGLLRAERRRRQLSVRAAAGELRVAPSTVGRIEDGQSCALTVAVQVLRWLGAADRG